MPLTWADAGSLGRALHARFPTRDPLTIRLPDLERWVREVDGFSAASEKPTPRALEAIQAKWYEAFQG